MKLDYYINIAQSLYVGRSQMELREQLPSQKKIKPNLILEEISILQPKKPKNTYPPSFKFYNFAPYN